MENAFAFVPILYNKNNDDDDNENFNCQNCGKENIIPFPCYECHQVYCSKDCRNSHKNIHIYECIGHKKFLFHEIGIAYLAFRVFIKGFDLLIDDLIEELCTNDNNDYQINNSLDLWSKIIDMAKKKESKNQYYEILNLVSNIEKMNSTDLLQYRLTAIMLTCYLKEFTNFFQNFIDNKNDKLQKILTKNVQWEIIISTLITQHICQMICNAHTIDTLIIPFYQQTNHIWLDNINLKYGMLHSYSLQSKIHAAIYPKISLYNHSCESNFHNRFNKLKLIIISNKDIQKNDEIFNCYGINYKLMNRNTRRNYLKQQYFFECNCIHCTNDNSDNEYYVSMYLYIKYVFSIISSISSLLYIFFVIE